MTYPSLDTADRQLTHQDSYKFVFRGKRCHIWLDTRGTFHSRLENGVTHHGYSLRDVHSELYMDTLHAHRSRT